MKKLLFLLPLLTIYSCSDSDNPHNAKFNDRGCLECDAYQVGDKFIIEGINYTVADRKLINDEIKNKNNISRFCTSHIVDMSNLFGSPFSSDPPTSFNQDIGSWDVSNVYTMDNMFLGASSFNRDIGNWDVSNVISMNGMFRRAEAFNQDIGRWDVSNVTNMDYLFSEATSFNQDLTQWCVTNIPSMPDGFRYRYWALSEQNLPIWGTCPADNATLPISIEVNHNYKENLIIKDEIKINIPIGWEVLPNYEMNEILNSFNDNSQYVLNLDYMLTLSGAESDVYPTIGVLIQKDYESTKLNFEDFAEMLVNTLSNSSLTVLSGMNMMITDHSELGNYIDSENHILYIINEGTVANLGRVKTIAAILFKKEYVISLTLDTYPQDFKKYISALQIMANSARI